MIAQKDAKCETLPAYWRGLLIAASSIFFGLSIAFAAYLMYRFILLRRNILDKAIKDLSDQSTNDAATRSPKDVSFPELDLEVHEQKEILQEVASSLQGMLKWVLLAFGFFGAGIGTFGFAVLLNLFSGTASAS